MKSFAFKLLNPFMGFPGGSEVKNLPAKAGVILPGKSHGQRSLVGYSSWGCKGHNTLNH
jgi:hypothetical protein